MNTVGKILVILNFLFAMVVAYLFTCVAGGLLISTRTDTQMEAFQLAQSLFLPAIFLSGYIFPFSGMPFFLRAIGQVFPTTHMIRIMRGIKQAFDPKGILNPGKIF